MGTALVLLAAAAVLGGPRRYVVDGLSMAPGLMPGDVVATGWLPVVDRFRQPGRFERWIVEAADGGAAIKRVAGLPGEQVSLRDGDLLVDGLAVVKNPAELAEVALPAPLPVVRDRQSATLSPADVLDDVPFATEVNRPLERVADVGIAARISPGPEGCRVRVGLGGGRIVWQLPPGVACRLIAGRLDGRLVAVAWRDRRQPTPDDGRRGLPDRVPAAWQIATPWPRDRAGAADAGVTVTVDAAGMIERIEVWRDVHYRPSGGGPTSWRLGGDAYLMLGDFPTASIDSRAWGPRPRHTLRQRIAPRP